MQTPSTRTITLSVGALAVIMFALAGPAKAASLYWDSNDTTAGAGATPTGTWGTDNFWSTSSLGTSATAAYTAASDVVFSAGTDAVNVFTVTLTSTQDAASLKFEEGASTISGTDGIITLSGTGGNVAVNTGASATIGNNTTILIGGSVGLTKAGSGTLTLDGSSVNTFTGGLNVSGGTLALDFANLGTPTDLINSGNALTLGGGNLTIKGKTDANDSSQTFASTSVNAGGGSILVDPNNGTSTTVVLNSLGTLSSWPVGSSLLVGKAVTANTGTVAFTTTTDKDAQGIYGGRIVFANGTADTGYDWATTTSGSSPYTLSAYAGYIVLPTTPTTSTVNYNLTNGATLTPGQSDEVNSLKLAPSAANQIVALGTNTMTINSGGLLVTGTDAVQITGTAGATRLMGSASGDLVVHQYNSGGLTISAVIGNNVGATALTKTGTSALILSGANTYTGATNVLNGTLQLTGSLNTSTTLNLANSGKFILGVNQQVAGLTSTGTGTASSIVGGKTTASTLTVAATGTNTFAGTIGGSGTNENNIYFTFIGIASGTSGKQTLTGVNSFTGGFKLSQGTVPGVLSVSDIKDAGVPCNIGAGTATGSVAIALRGGTLQYTGDTATTNRGFRLSTANSTIEVSKDNATLTLGACELTALTLNVTGGSGSRLAMGATLLNPGPATLNPTTANLTVASFSGNNYNLILSGTSTNNVVSGVIGTGTGTLTKNNTSIWTLSGANTYIGTTTINAGKLLLGEGATKGSMGNTAVSVTSTGTYGMSYTSSGTTVQGGKTLSLASGTTLDLRDGNTNTLNFTTTGSALNGANMYFDLGTTVGANDQLTLTDATTVSGTNTLYFTATGGTLANGTYTIITSGSGLDGATFILETATLLGKTLSLTATPPTATTITLTVSDGDPYATWALSGDNAFDADANNDGVDNGMAWVLGATNKEANATSLLPTLDNTDPNYFIFTYNRDDDAKNDTNTTIKVEYCSDLAVWSPATHNGTTIIIPTPIDDGGGLGIDLVQVKISRTLASGGKLFARLNVVKAP
jgi:fibronectin-binding autotransporter adhesin